MRFFWYDSLNTYYTYTFYIQTIYFKMITKQVYINHARWHGCLRC